MTTAAILFWLFLGVVFYTYLGYAVLLRALVALREAFSPARPFPPPEHLPEVTLLIAAYNEQEIVAAKTANCRALDYPAGKLRLVWVTDGSTDRTVELLSACKEVTVLHDARRGGKTAALNRAIELIRTPIVIFTDANTMLNPDAVRAIVRCFDDPQVGCVAGEKRVAADGGTETDNGTETETDGGTKNAGTNAPQAARRQDTDCGDKGRTDRSVSKNELTGSGRTDAAQRSAHPGAAATEGIYWRYESKLKEWDCRLSTAVGAAGELFAVRRELYEPQSEDTLLDDFMISMRIAGKGYRIAYCKDAYALETPSADMTEEGKRKRRIAAGGLQSVWRLRALLNPFRHGVLTFQYLSHRVLRWTLTPLLLVALLPLNAALLWSDRPALYAVTLALQAAFYLSALAGWLLERRGRRSRLLFIPYYFLFMNLNVFRGAHYLLTHRGRGAWEKSRRAG